VRGGEEVRGLFIGGKRRFGGRFFSRREVAGELERLLDWPDFAAPGDETARAAVGQLVQVKRRLGAARAVVERGWWLAVVVMRWWQAGGAGRGMAGDDGDGSGRRS
jgi:hypothetical protein